MPKAVSASAKPKKAASLAALGLSFEKYMAKISSGLANQAKLPANGPNQPSNNTPPPSKTSWECTIAVKNSDTTYATTVRDSTMAAASSPSSLRGKILISLWFTRHGASFLPAQASLSHLYGTCRQQDASITNYQEETCTHCHDHLAFAFAVNSAGAFHLPQRQLEGAIALRTSAAAPDQSTGPRPARLAARRRSPSGPTDTRHRADPHTRG